MRNRDETAAAHLHHPPAARTSELAADVLARLRGADALFVLDADGRLEGVASVLRLARAPPGTTVGACIEARPVALPLESDQEIVALHAVRHQLALVPLADAAGRFAGVVPAEALLQILHHEHVEDLHRLAGIRHETRLARDALSAAPLLRARHRLPWLIVGLAGSTLSAWVMMAFERTLAERVAVAFFIPGVVYLADAVGTQTEAIAVRFLSLSRVPFAKILWGEVRTGVFIGLALGLLALPAVALAVDVRIAIAVALSVVVAGTLATTVGLLFPWALWRLGKDPAMGSGPLATIVQDVLSLLVYFGIVTALLG